MTIEIKKVKNGYIVRQGGYDSGRLTLDDDFQVFETMDGLVEHLRETMEPESKPGPGFAFTCEELTPDWAKKLGDLTACVDARPK